MASALATPIRQSLILGSIFFFIFTAYMTIQGFASQLYGDQLAANMESVLYGVFTLGCFVSPAITNVLGPRLTLQLVRVENGVCSGDVMFERAGEPRGDDGAKRKAVRRRREGAQAPPAPSAAARPRGDKRQRQKAPSGGKKRARTA